MFMHIVRCIIANDFPSQFKYITSLGMCLFIYFLIALAAWACCESFQSIELSLLSAHGGFLLFCPLQLFLLHLWPVFLHEDPFSASCVFWVCLPCLWCFYLWYLFDLLEPWKLLVVTMPFSILSIEILLSEIMLFGFRKPFLCSNSLFLKVPIAFSPYFLLCFS